MQDLNICLVQSDIFWENPEKNRKWIEEQIQNIKTDLIVLPEMFTTGFSMQSEKLAENTLGETLAWMQKMSYQSKAVILGSLIVSENQDYFNRLLVVFPDGHFLHYDKRHLFRMAKEHKYFSSGSESIIFEWKDWKIKPLICYDLRFPVWSRNKIETSEEYHLLIYVANWPEKRIHHWKRLIQARAIENLSYAVGVNRTGVDDNGIIYNGQSFVADFHGEMITELTTEAKIIQTQLSSETLRTYRRAFPAYLDADDFTINF